MSKQNWKYFNLSSFILVVLALAVTTVTISRAQVGTSTSTSTSTSTATSTNNVATTTATSSPSVSPSVTPSPTATSSPSPTATTTPSPSPTGTSTATSTQAEIDNLKGEVSRLQMHLNGILAQLSNFWARLQALVTGQNGNGNGGIQEPASLTPTNMTVDASSSVDWNGRNFGKDEKVEVLLNDLNVMTVQADGGGNFTTGSFGLPSTPGTYNYIFRGMDSDTELNSTITVQ